MCKNQKRWRHYPTWRFLYLYGTGIRFFLILDQYNTIRYRILTNGSPWHNIVFFRRCCGSALVSMRIRILGAKN
jgi:hypothetical protein